MNNTDLRSQHVHFSITSLLLRVTMPAALRVVNMLCASHLVLRGTYSGRLSPVLQPALCQRGSAPPPTSAPAAAMALPYECLEMTIEAGSQHSALACSFGKKLLNSLCLPTFLFTRGLGLPMGQVSKLHFSVDPREVTVPLLREKSQRYL